jgi:hypothetical protein
MEQVADGPALRAVLLETGIVDIDPGSRVTFPLAIFAEWFAGQALLLEPGLLSDATFDRLLRWQYALVQAVGAATHEQAKPLLEGLVCSAPRSPAGSYTVPFMRSPCRPPPGFARATSGRNQSQEPWTAGGTPWGAGVGYYTVYRIK